MQNATAAGIGAGMPPGEVINGGFERGLSYQRDA
jgi:hypothetical protein